MVRSQSGRASRLDHAQSGNRYAKVAARIPAKPAAGSGRMPGRL